MGPCAKWNCFLKEKPISFRDTIKIRSRHDDILWKYGYVLCNSCLFLAQSKHVWVEGEKLIIELEKNFFDKNMDPALYELIVKPQRKIYIKNDEIPPSCPYKLEHLMLAK